MNVKLEIIEMDTSIQCRASIDTAVVNDYAERMEEGDEFPPVELYGSKAQYWIGDGWHRIMAALQVGAKDISATVHQGTRADALKSALGANAVHGHRRSNADKRRCVEIALREFSKLSSRAISDMCGVSNRFVDGLRPALGIVPNATRTTTDGRQYPATRTPPVREAPLEPQTEPKRELPKLGPPCNGMQYAELAIMDLEQIAVNDAERKEAFAYVKGWIKDHEI